MSELKIKPYPGKGFEPAPSDRGWLPLEVPTDLNVNTVKLVKDFAEAMMLKLLEAQHKYGYQAEWMTQELVPDMRQDLWHHMEKGDPRDVAAYCAFLWFHNESTISSSVVEAAAAQMFESLKHGDESHQSWLKAAILAHMRNESKPEFVETTKKETNV